MLQTRSACRDYTEDRVPILWYGLSFYYHANMEGKAPLETTIHIMATYIIYVIVACLVVEAAVPGAFTAQLVRCLAVLMLGTWFWHTSFVMYIPGWPGSHANPQWDRHDHTNVHFIIACFGFHLAVNIVVVLVVYVISHVLVYRSHGLMTSQCCHGDDSIALIQQSHNHSKDKHSARSSTSTAAVQMFTDDASDSDGHSDV